MTRSLRAGIIEATATGWIRTRPARTYTRPPHGMAANDPNRASDSPSPPGPAPWTGASLPVGARAGGAAGGGDQPRRTPRHAAQLPAGGDRQPRGARPRARTASCPSRRSPTSDRRCCASCAASTASAGRATHELLVVLPGADGPRGEIVARRVLERLRTIKIEADGMRRPLRVSVGLAAWRADLMAQARLLAHTGAAGAGSQRAPARRARAPEAPTRPRHRRPGSPDPP